MTRATERLYLTSDGNPSKFIADINPKFLMSENPAYEPINVTEAQMSILGIAVGVVKK